MAASVQIVPVPSPQTPQQYDATHPDLHFDRSQFDHKFYKMSSADSELSFDDIGKMHLFRVKGMRAAARWVSPWVTSDEKLRAVCLFRAWNWSLRSGHRKPMPANISWQQVKQLCDATFARWKKDKWGGPAWEQRNIERFISCVEAAGGYLEMISALAYRSFRSGEDAIEIGNKMQMSHAQVRQHIFRLNQAAVRLGFEQHVHHRTRGRVCRPEELLKKRETMGYSVPRKKLHYSVELHALVLKYRALGWTMAQIALKHSVSLPGLRTAFHDYKRTGTIRPAKVRRGRKHAR